MTEGQKERFGKAVWRCRQPHNGLPEGPGPDNHDFLFLCLPCPETGLAERLFRQRYLSDLDVSKLNLIYFKNLLLAVESTKQRGIALTLSPAEAEQILKHILTAWSRGPLRQYIENPSA